ncbi:MAG: hypothetical protein WDA07_00620 [Leucobacter sp.]
MSHTETTDQAKHTAIFAPSPRPRITFGTAILVLLTVILVFGGFYLMGAAFSVPEEQAFWVFAAALALDTIGFWIAFGIIPSRER